MNEVDEILVIECEECEKAECNKECIPYHWEVKRPDYIEQYNDGKLYLQSELTDHEFNILTLISLAEKMRS